jgi:pyrimidine 5'-nucleotidase
MTTGSPRFRFLLCDLDNTLYPPDSGLMTAVGRRMVRYIVERVGIPPDEAEDLKLRYYQKYGTTMRGLILHQRIDPEDYLAFVHDLPLEGYIQPNPDLESSPTLTGRTPSGCSTPWVCTTISSRSLTYVTSPSTANLT